MHPRRPALPGPIALVIAPARPGPLLFERDPLSQPGEGGRRRGHVSERRQDSRADARGPIPYATEPQIAASRLAATPQSRRPRWWVSLEAVLRPAGSPALREAGFARPLPSCLLRPFCPLPPPSLRHGQCPGSRTRGLPRPCPPPASFGISNRPGGPAIGTNAASGLLQGKPRDRK